MNGKVTPNPDADHSARGQHEDLADDMSEIPENLAGRDSSSKSGKKSSAKKLGASRPDFGPSAKAKPVPGAHGDGPQTKDHRKTTRDGG
jgi:hypothetical protein